MATIDNEPTEAARPSWRPPQRPELKNSRRTCWLPSESSPGTPFCAAGFTGLSRRRSKALQHRVRCRAIDTPELVTTWLSTTRWLLSGDRCGEMASRSSLSWSNGPDAFRGLGQLLSASTLFINWFAAAVSMHLLDRDGLLKEPAGAGDQWGVSTRQQRSSSPPAA